MYDMQLIKMNLKPRTYAFIVLILLMGTSCIPLSNPQSIDQFAYESQNIAITRQLLYSPTVSTNTYLIDNTGRLNHYWSSQYFPGEAVRWLGNGTILRTIKTTMSGFGGEGGGIEKVTWDGTITWRFYYFSSNHFCSHHDIYPLSNGNVLIIAWETKTYDEAIAAGVDPQNLLLEGYIFPDHIIEVQPIEPLGGIIVWEWHTWDHLIQDYDPSKENFGVVEDHPELIDANYRILSQRDWMHTNSIDYNEEFDQILISVCYFDEIWIIDHSTTTEEAAGHTGGNSGKGGDLLYRWGNPAAYRAGTKNDQKFFHQHDATWINKGCPGEGNILVLNNGVGRPEGRYSSVDEIVPPVDDSGLYSLEPGTSYGPETPIWSYTGDPPTSFFCNGISGAQRLEDGNTLICAGSGGDFFEVTAAGTIVWTYTNPYPNPLTNNVFKLVYIPLQSPNPPSNPFPVNASTNVSMKTHLSWTAIDPDSYYGLTYDVYFGTTSTPPKVSSAQTNTSYSPGTLNLNTKYYWRIVATDAYGQSSVSPLWSFTTGSSTNYPPNTPEITGEATGTIQTVYYYFIETTDPDSDHVQYYIDWGDGTTTVTGFFESGDATFESHTWNSRGIYNVKVLAIDEYGAESEWATLKVTMPCLYHMQILQFLEVLLQWFPHAFPLIRQIIERYGDAG